MTKLEQLSVQKLASRFDALEEKVNGYILDDKNWKHEDQLWKTTVIQPIIDDARDRKIIDKWKDRVAKKGSAWVFLCAALAAILFGYLSIHK